MKQANPTTRLTINKWGQKCMKPNDKAQTYSTKMKIPLKGKYWFFGKTVLFPVQLNYWFRMPGDYEEGELNSYRDERRERSRSRQSDRRHVFFCSIVNCRNQDSPEGAPMISWLLFGCLNCRDRRRDRSYDRRYFLHRLVTCTGIVMVARILAVGVTTAADIATRAGTCLWRSVMCRRSRSRSKSPSQSHRREETSAQKELRAIEEAVKSARVALMSSRQCSSRAECLHDGNRRRSSSSTSRGGSK